MRNKTRILALVFIFSAYLFIPGLNATAQNMPPLLESMASISMDFKDASLKDILKMLSIQSGLNFIASEGVQDRKITLYLDKVPVQEAMDELFKANNLSYELNPDNNIFIVKDWGKPKVTLETRVFPLKYATVSTAPLANEVSNNSLTTSSSSGSSGTTSTTSTTSTSSISGTGSIGNAVKKFLSENGSVAEDGRTNSLIVTDVPVVFPTVEKTIRALDIPVPQVMLEVEMLDVSKNTIDNIGVKYGQTPLSLSLTGSTTGIIAGYPFHSWFKTISNAPVDTVGSTIKNNTSYTLIVDYLRTQTDTKYLARPRILTLNNQPAEIKVETDEAVGSITVQQGQGTSTSSTISAERAQTGVELRITPQINTETGEVTMFVQPKVTEASLSSITVGTQATKDTETRTANVLVKIKDGDTMVIGGLLRNEKAVTVTKLPILGDLPFIGTLFRHKSVTKDKERELLVFITPRIIKDQTVAQLGQGKKPAVPMREQPGLAPVDRKRMMRSNLREFEARNP